MSRVLSGALLAGLAFAAVEVGLRLQDSALPSMRGTTRPFVPSERPAVLALADDVKGCVEPDANGEPPTAWRLTYGADQRPPLRILFVGDSVTLGQGVSPEETYGALLGAALSATHNHPVEVVNGAVNAAGYCGVFRSMHHHHAHGHFDRTVVALFADDLEQRAVLLEGDRILANPKRLNGIVADVASRSHAFNWLWYFVVSQAVERLTDSGSPLPPHVTVPGRSVPESTLSNLRSSIDRVASERPMFVLLPPVGAAVCSTDAAPTSECGWMTADLGLMAEVLNESGVDWFDLRSYPTQAHQLESERRDWRRDGRLPVHPNREGHSAIAAVLQDRFTIE